MRAQRAEYSQADTAENYRELERWANERAPIFPVYEYRAQAVAGGALGSAVPVEYPTGTEVSLQVQKKFDWTVLVCSLNITCYVAATGRLDFYSTLDDDYPGSDFLICSTSITLDTTVLSQVIPAEWQPKLDPIRFRSTSQP